MPESAPGQLFATAFMLAAISCEVYLFSRVAMLPLQSYRRKMEQRVLGQYGRPAQSRRKTPPHHRHGAAGGARGPRRASGAAQGCRRQAARPKRLGCGGQSSTLCNAGSCHGCAGPSSSFFTGSELREEQLWELASGDQMRALGLSQSDDFVTREEFCLMMLVRLERITPEDLQLCQGAFDKLDVLKNGQLDWRDLRAADARRERTQMSKVQALD